MKIAIVFLCVYVVGFYFDTVSSCKLYKFAGNISLANTNAYTSCVSNKGQNSCVDPNYGWTLGFDGTHFTLTYSNFQDDNIAYSGSWTVATMKEKTGNVWNVLGFIGNTPNTLNYHYEDTLNCTSGADEPDPQLCSAYYGCCYITDPTTKQCSPGEPNLLLELDDVSLVVYMTDNVDLQYFNYYATPYGNSSFSWISFSVETTVATHFNSGDMTITGYNCDY